MNNFRLDNKTAIITGSASGIGRSIAEKLAENGAKVHLLDINKEAVQLAADSIKSNGYQATGHWCDVTRQKLVLKLFEKIQKKDGLHILVNNAGIGFIGNLEQTTEADFDRIYKVNVKGVYNCLYAGVPHIKTNGGGVVLNMASIVSTVGIPDRFAYTMSKGAVLSMTYSVAKDYLQHNIRCKSQRKL